MPPSFFRSPAGPVYVRSNDERGVHMRPFAFSMGFARDWSALENAGLEA